MSNIDVEASDVIKLIHQFLKENNLTSTLKTLEKESGVRQVIVDNLEQFQNEILEGEWDKVLSIITSLDLPQKLLFEIYEHVVLELIESKDLGAARMVLRQTDVLDQLKKLNPNRFEHLEHWLSRSFFIAKEAYPNGHNRLKRRESLCQALTPYVTIAPPSRLLTLINQALQYQHLNKLLPSDTGYDLVTNQVKIKTEEPDMIPNKFGNVIKLPKKHVCNTLVYSPDGQFLITGVSDGFLEVFNPITGKLRMDLKYQYEETPMLMSTSILSLAISSDSQYLASGSMDGTVKVWKILTGQVIKTFNHAHSSEVNCLKFHPNQPQLISGGLDTFVRVLGLKSGKRVKEFRGHTGFINSIHYLNDGEKVMSAGSEGSIRIWDVKSSTCLQTITSMDLGLGLVGSNDGLIGGLSISQILPIPLTNQLLILSRTNTLTLISNNGKVLKKLHHPNPPTQIGKSENTVQHQQMIQKLADHFFLSATISPKFTYIYALHTDGNIYPFTLPEGELMEPIKVDKPNPLGLLHHPQSMSMTVFGQFPSVQIYTT